MDQEETSQHEITCEWEIQNFSMCPQAKGESLASHTFSVDCMDGSVYQLVLYPRGRKSDADDTALCLLECRVKSHTPLNVKLNIAYEGNSAVVKADNILLNSRESMDFPITLPKPPLEPGVLRTDSLTITCAISLMYDPYALVRDLVDLRDNLWELYESGYFCDFCLTSKEGRDFSVHKVMLIVRCRELCKKAGVFENFQDYRMEETSTRALQAFLQYVYTGRLPDRLDSLELIEVSKMADEFDMRDLKLELTPLEFLTSGRTTVAVHHHDVTWNLEDYHERMETRDWPAKQYLDLGVGHFVASFSTVVRGVGRTEARIDLESTSSSALYVKCVVQVVNPIDESREIVCKGEHRFPSDDLFSMKGVLPPRFSYRSVENVADDFALVLDFKLSVPGGFDRCVVRDSVKGFDYDAPRLRMRSLYRLSSDLEKAYERGIEEDEDAEWKTHSDLRVYGERVMSGEIPAHRCILWTRSWCLKYQIETCKKLDRHYEMRLRDENLVSLRHVFRYVYSGKLDKDISVVELLMVYQTSKRLEMKGLVFSCLRLLHSRVDLEHLRILLQRYEEWEDDALLDVAVRFTVKNKFRVLMSPEWAEIEDKFRGGAVLIKCRLFDEKDTHV